MFAAIQNPVVNSTKNVCVRSGHCFEKNPKEMGHDSNLRRTSC